MGFYDLTKEERAKTVAYIEKQLQQAWQENTYDLAIPYFSDDDTYIRKAAYLAIGKMYKSNLPLQSSLIKWLSPFLKHPLEKVRQTTINAAGEIGIIHFEPVASFFDTGLFDTHHIVRNAVIGSIKKMGEKNPVPVLNWCKQYLHHPDKEIRREICHGIELRGRKHPQDILPLLQSLEHDTTARVSKTLVHVLGQISYKKHCLETVLAHIKHWQNKHLIQKALDEIIDVHDRYKNFSYYTQQEAITIVQKYFPNT